MSDDLNAHNASGPTDKGPGDPGGNKSEGPKPRIPLGGGNGGDSGANRPGGEGGSSKGSGGQKPPTRWTFLPIAILIGLFLIMLLAFGGGGASDYTQISSGKFGALVEIPAEDNPLRRVTRVGDQEYRGELIPGREGRTADGQTFAKFRTEIGSQGIAENLAGTDQRLKELLGENFDTQRASSPLTSLLGAIVPWLLIFALLYFLFFRQMSAAGGMGGQGGIFGFTRSKARRYNKETVGITFDDVAGVDEAREEVHELVQFLKQPEKFRRLGGRIPRGVLLVGPPGTGKTLLAKAIAGEADVPFYSISGSDFVEMFVGVGASRVRDLFKTAKENSPCIIFLDELDAVGRQRGAGLGGGHDEREQTLNSILVEMDGFESDEGIIVMAATNRSDVLDPALLRPGRFDRQIEVGLPDVKGREEIFKVHVKNVKRAEDVDLRRMARSTPGFSGAEIANLVNEAAIIAAMQNKDAVDLAALEEARDKVRFGRAKKGRVMPEKDLKVTAFHEAGHTLVQHFVPEADPIHKVTIIPRGQAGGATMSLPTDDRNYISEVWLRSFLAVAYGGRMAERIVFNQVTTGASSDIKQATNLARKMVTEWGMSTKVGPLFYSDSEEHMFLGREIARSTNHGEKVTELIDDECRRLIDEGEKEAERILTEYRDKLDVVAEALLEFETLSGEELRPLMEGEMTLDDLRKIKPTSPRQIRTTEDFRREQEEAASREEAQVDDGEADNDGTATAGTPSSASGESASGGTSGTGGTGDPSTNGGGSNTGGGGLPRPKSLDE